MEAIIPAALALLAQVAPTLVGAGPMQTAIQLVAAILPPAIEFVPQEVQVIKGIIGTLRSNHSVTTEQMGELDALDAQCDAPLDSAITAAEAADQAPPTS